MNPLQSGPRTHPFDSGSLGERQSLATAPVDRFAEPRRRRSGGDPE
jgi:hypothetical protein